MCQAEVTALTQELGAEHPLTKFMQIVMPYSHAHMDLIAAWCVPCLLVKRTLMERACACVKAPVRSRVAYIVRMQAALREHLLQGPLPAPQRDFGSTKHSCRKARPCGRHDQVVLSQGTSKLCMQVACSSAAPLMHSRALTLALHLRTFDNQALDGWPRFCACHYSVHTFVLATV